MLPEASSPRISNAAAGSWLLGLLLMPLLVGPTGRTAASDPESRRSADTPTRETWWAFQPLVRPAVPVITGPTANQVASPIDAFLLETLRPVGQGFARHAHPRTRLRRAASDLLGLPPTALTLPPAPPAGDETPDWWPRSIDALLASPHYGEAQGRDWLDLVRYAETDGFKSDAIRPQAYRYRDYVIRAFNQDRAYSRFVQEQIAGDELFPEETEAIVATGFNRMWPDESNASNVLLARQDALNDLTANVGNVFLGLSMGCAQCHDHKFDPILQSDFYRLQAYFAGIVLANTVPVGTPGELRAYQDALTGWLSRTRQLRDELQAIEQAGRTRAFAIKRRKFPSVVLEAVDTPPERRSAFQHQLAFWTERQLPVDEKKLSAALSAADRKRRAVLKKQLAELTAQKPAPPVQVNAMATLEVASGPASTFVLGGGNYEVPLEEVAPGPPEVLQQTRVTPADVPTRRPGSSGRRAALARWLTADDHPLTARVMVNRIWQGHFGQGLIDNANDLGRQTAAPRHRRLLDWLAVEFVESGWSIKHMHRRIMTSRVYQQAGRHTLTSDAPPPYSYFPRRRLSAERIRDAMLVAADQLDTRLYGPPVRPNLPPGFGTRYTWKTSKSTADRSRRSIYIHAKRNLPYPLLRVFDQPDMHESCARRPQTTIAPQALVLLNSELVLDLSRGVVKRIQDATYSKNIPARVRHAWLTVLGREPQKDELAGGIQFLAEQSTRSEAKDEVTRANDALLDLCHVLINTNEFLYID
jgi:hypothetical protein